MRKTPKKYMSRSSKIQLSVISILENDLKRCKVLHRFCQFWNDLVKLFLRHKRIQPEAKLRSSSPSSFPPIIHAPFLLCPFSLLLSYSSILSCPILSSLIPFSTPVFSPSTVRENTYLYGASISERPCRGWHGWPEWDPTNSQGA